MTYQPYYLTTMSNYFELCQYEISNPRPGFMPRMPLHAIGSGISGVRCSLAKEQSSWHNGFFTDIGEYMEYFYCSKLLSCSVFFVQ